MVRLVDVETGAFVPGCIRVMEGGETVGVPQFVNRGLGLPERHPGRMARPDTTGVDLCAASDCHDRRAIDAYSGLETEGARVTIDLSSKHEAETAIPLRSFANLARDGWRSGDTYLYLHGITREEAD